MTMTNRKIAGLMRRHGWKKNAWAFARNATSWCHSAHPDQLVTVGKMGPDGPHFILTGPVLTLAVPATLSEEKAVECWARGLDLYGADSFTTLLERVLDWLDIQAADKEFFQDELSQGSTDSL